MEAKLHIPNLHLPSSAPRTVVEKEVPEYGEGSNDRQPSYLEKILSLTTDVKTITKEAEQKAATNNNNAAEESGVLDGDENNNNGAKNAGDNEEKFADHSTLMNAQLKWQISRDFGTYELTHFDRPHPAEEITSILDTVLEENRIVAINNRKNTLIPRKGTLNKSSPRTPSSVRSLSPSLPVTKPKGKGRVAHTDKTYNQLMELSSDHNNNNNNNQKNVNQSQRSKSPVMQGDWLPSLRPLSQNSCIQPYKETKKTSKKLKKQSEKLTSTNIKLAIRKIFDDYLSGNIFYDADFLRNNVTLLADLIKTKIKHFYGSRYRLICMVNIFENKEQSARMVSRCCWDVEKDDFTECTFEGDNFTATCVVYAVYME